jgi:hypothetical protein
LAYVEECQLTQLYSSSHHESIGLSSHDGVIYSAGTSQPRPAKDSPTEPAKKKAAISNDSKPKPKRVKMLGKLSGVLALPLDIFFEITSHLHPLDLLRLSRASRHFARMFLRKDNRHAWLASRRTVEGLPDCPSDISEAQYAHLLFESVCSVSIPVCLDLSFAHSAYYAGLRQNWQATSVQPSRSLLRTLLWEESKDTFNARRGRSLYGGGAPDCTSQLYVLMLVLTFCTPADAKQIAPQIRALSNIFNINSTLLGKSS